LLKPGVNIYGYVYAESGVGEITRLLVSTVKEAGLDYAVIPFTETLSRQDTKFSDLGTLEPEFDVNIIGVNADQMSVFLETFGRSAIEDRYSIGLWAWELEHFPDWMARSADLIDEVWAISEYTGRAIAKEVCRPVQSFPLPIAAPVPPPRTRQDLGLPEGFLFMFCFDLDSVFARKNPIAVMDAFTQAFARGEGPQLVVKSINGDRHPQEVAMLHEAAARHPDITYVDGYLPIEDQRAFFASCDAYISLHRAEGFGLTMAEAMALGKPVIATDYSGNLDFMDSQNSYLVPWEYRPIGPGSEPYPEDVLWADPDVDAAATLMRFVFENPDDVSKKTARAVRDIDTYHSPRARSKFVVERLKRVRQELDRRGPGSRRAAATSSLPAFPRAEQQMMPRPFPIDLDRLLNDIAALIDRGPALDNDFVNGVLGETLQGEEWLGVRANYAFQSEINQALLRLIRVTGELAVGQWNFPETSGISAELSENLMAASQIAAQIAATCQERFEGAADVVRDLHLLAARLRGLRT